MCSKNQKFWKGPMEMRCQCLQLRHSDLPEFALASSNMQVVEMNLQSNAASAGHQTSTPPMHGSFIQCYLQSGPVFCMLISNRVKSKSPLKHESFRYGSIQSPVCTIKGCLMRRSQEYQVGMTAVFLQNNTLCQLKHIWCIYRNKSMKQLDDFVSSPCGQII